MVWLVLAAGRSSRFNGDKLLAPLRDGRPLILHTLKKLPQATPVYVITRPDNPALIEVLVKHFRQSPNQAQHLLVCPEAPLGMGHVIAWSIRTLRAQHNLNWIGILLGDMPFVAPQTFYDLQLLAERVGQPFIITPTFNGKRGHPVLFSHAMQLHLENLSGDVGAGHWLRDPGLAAMIIRNEVDDPGILDDIDTREQLQSYLA